MESDTLRGVTEPAARYRVLHVVPWVSMGGVERRRVLLARYLGDGFEQRVACLTASGSVSDELRGCGVRIHQFAKPGEGITKPMVHVRLHQLVREFRPHILHGAIFEGMTWGAVAGLVQRTPVVLLEETSCPNGTSPVSMRRSRKAEMLIRFLAQRASGIIAVSPKIGEYLTKEVRISANAVHVILNGIARFDAPSAEEVRAERERLGFSDGAFVLGGVGRVYEQVKRFRDLLDVVKNLRRSRDVRAMIVGQGPDLAALKSYADQLGIADSVVFTGRREDRALFLAVMDVFVLSSATEAAPLALMEAMMAGRPSVATTVGGVTDIASDENTALLVPPCDPERLGRAIARLLDDEPLRRHLATRAREHAVECLSAERYASDVRALYLAKLEQASARRGLQPFAESTVSRFPRAAPRIL